MSDALLHVENLTYGFQGRRPLLEDAELVLEPGQAFGVLKRAALETGLTPNRWDPEMLFGEIQRAKDCLVGPDEYVRVPGSYFEEHVARAYRRYQPGRDHRRICIGGSDLESADGGLRHRGDLCLRQRDQ